MSFITNQRTSASSVHKRRDVLLLHAVLNDFQNAENDKDAH